MPAGEEEAEGKGMRTYRTTRLALQLPGRYFRSWTLNVLRIHGVNLIPRFRKHTAIYTCFCKRAGCLLVDERYSTVSEFEEEILRYAQVVPTAQIQIILRFLRYLPENALMFLLDMCFVGAKTQDQRSHCMEKTHKILMVILLGFDQLGFIKSFHTCLIILSYLGRTHCFLEIFTGNAFTLCIEIIIPFPCMYVCCGDFTSLRRIGFWTQQLRREVSFFKKKAR
mmetsp:Transcript_11872/g.15470  ORF Transcript_11872/g.15470 Transcript_11872/m.15470 type:complete len:224 (+) Transcript_11872:354-1025(+)